MLECTAVVITSTAGTAFVDCIFRHLEPRSICAPASVDRMDN
jgi:hypothetical protein